MTKRFLDWSEFSTNKGALDLLKESMRDGLEFDAYGNTNRFIAIALTPSYELDDVEAEGYGSPYTGPNMGVGLKHKFKARILGDHSPHMFLPDPCLLSVKDAEAPEALSSIAQHTDFVQLGTLGGAYVRVSPGDIVEVELRKNVFSYDLQVGKFIRVVALNANAKSMVSDLQCTNLVKDFYTMDPPPTSEFNLDDIPGHTIIVEDDDVVLGKEQVEFLEALAAVLETKWGTDGTPLVKELTITSGWRSAQGQAKAMQDILRDSASEFKTQYEHFGDTYRQLVSFGSNTGALPNWSRTVRDAIARGQFKGHCTGMAVDIATKPLGEEQLYALQQSLELLGAEVHAEKSTRWHKRSGWWKRKDSGSATNEHWHIRLPTEFQGSIARPPAGWATLAKDEANWLPADKGGWVAPPVVVVEEPEVDPVEVKEGEKGPSWRDVDDDAPD